MNKYLMQPVLALGLFSCCSFFNVALAQDLADISEKAEKCVVRINIQSEDSGGHGSGFLVDEIGTIVTNCHVIAGASKATVVFSDNTSYEVEGTYHIDPQRDIAVLMLTNPPRRPCLKIAPQLPRKGETVTAIGAPHGLDFTVTRGIVSAVRTSDQMKQFGLDEHLGTWLQVDSAISPGNSGGPLLNSQGDVIGMSTMVLAVGQNLNFGISGVDITQAVSIAKSRSVQPLASGAALIKPPKASRGPGKVAPVPKSAVDQYVTLGKKDYAKLVTKLKGDLVAQNKVLKDYKSGEVINEPIFNNGRKVDAGYVQSRSGNLEWLFANQKSKDGYVERQTEICRQLKDVYQGTRSGMTNESLLQMLSKAGPELDPRKMKSVGFVREVRFMAAINEVASVVDIDGKPYVAELESMAGLFPGEVLLPCPMYVKDTITVKTPNGSIPATILQQVSDTLLESAVMGTSANVAASNPSDASTESSSVEGLGDDTDLFSTSGAERQWTAKSGHKMKGVMLSKTATHVKIKRSDNQKVIEVKIDTLSDADRKFLSQ